jgi:hypothetical protein
MLVGYAEALGDTKAAAMHDRGDIDPNQELIARRPRPSVRSPSSWGDVVALDAGYFARPVRPQPLGVCGGCDPY